MVFASRFLGVLLPTLLVLLSGVTVSAGAELPTRVLGLRCEYRHEPLGIGALVPRLSWQIESSLRGQKQTAYRVLVASSPDALQAGRGDLWDSGKVVSDQSINVPYAGAALVSGQRCFWKVMVWGNSGDESGWSDVSFWEMGLLKTADWTGSWIFDGKPLPTDDADFFKDDPAPLFRREFSIARKVRSARLYIAGLGLVDTSLNGHPVGDHRLDPLWTTQTKRIFYCVYDVTQQLSVGSNCLGVTLGNGWYNPLPLRMWGHLNLRDHLPVGRPQFIAQLNIEYEDGSSQHICSDGSWKFSPGPILQNSIYLGEKVDARKSIAGWDAPGLNDADWKPAAVAPVPQGTLEPLSAPPIRVTTTLKPIDITEPAKGVYIADMGQNFAGLARFHFNVPRGTEIKIRYGELLHKDGSLNPMTSVCGQIKRKSDGKDGSPAVAWQTDSYIAGGGPEEYTPRFTFHGFRYVELVGLPSKPSVDDIQGLRMNADVEPVGSFTCSNELFNHIQTMCQWTFLSNLFGVQSDCPHRERLGYGGDLVNTAESFMLNFDMETFYAKAARDWHDSALPNGMLTDTAPSVGIQYCGLGWAMAHPTLVTQLYRYYGDRRLVEEQYDTAKRWLDLVRTQNPDNILHHGLNDHEALQSEKTPPMVTPLYCESARMVASMAHILGKESDAAEYDQLAAAIQQAYQKEFTTAGTGKVASGIQSVQAFALDLNMLPRDDRPAALELLMHDISDQHHGHLTTGIFGTRYMLDALSRSGHADVVNNMANLRDFPSWGYMLDNGATTLWEHWAISDSTYSQNHPMFGSVSQWFYNWAGGIEADRDACAFDKFTFQPQFLSGLDWTSCTYRSIRGPITCNWRRAGNQITLDLQVPVSTTATLQLPAGTVTENGQPFAESKGVKQPPGVDGSHSFILESGQYHLAFTPEARP